MIALDRKWDLNKRRDERELLCHLVETAGLDAAARHRIAAHATRLVERIRAFKRPGLMDVVLAEYGLSTQEGVALMSLAEALLRVPDSPTADALIKDKIASSDWSSHLGRAASPLVNSSTLGLLIAGNILADVEPGLAGRLHAMVRRLGEPVIGAALGQAMRVMGRQFVLGQDIRAAMARAARREAQGYTYSYDMLGEAAMTAGDAARYARAYASAIDAIARACRSSEVAANPGISIKLSALHPRYEVAQADRVMTELVPVVTGLAAKAAAAGMGLNVDAEEMDRLALSLGVIEAVLADPALANWDGFGVVVQAYGRRAGDVIAALHDLAGKYARRIAVRLVKGAYWDSEVKRAQVEGLEDFPVFTRKAATDVSYIAHARTLLAMSDRLYPQFATHNAHTVATVLDLANGLPRDAFEFQRLHGMGETLHDIVRADMGTRCRIYAPVGLHRDLLAYLVRRLLENGANSSFVNRLLDAAVPAAEVAACPFAALEAAPGPNEPRLAAPVALFGSERVNSRGFDLADTRTLDRIEAARARPAPWRVQPIMVRPPRGGVVEVAHNPATGANIGEVTLASASDVEAALDAALPWDAPAAERAAVLSRAADIYEADFGRLFALVATEAGRTLPDAVTELREAVDFLRYYAAKARALEGRARGVFTCISPWNFPLAIFTGQVAAALAAGNAVLAKPAEATPAIAAWGVRHLLAAGVPATALQFLPGHGRTVGAALTSDLRVSGVAFTGSIATARAIQRAMAEGCAPGTPLIAETGGINAMLVDSTALPEQAVRDIVASAFRSAGQRCSALRCLYVQEDIAPTICEMLIGAMKELRLGDPWSLASDVGPVITRAARDEISAYVERAEAEGRLLHRLAAPEKGHFVGPSLIMVEGIGEIEREVFGPVLHLATFSANRLGDVVAAVNATGYGLTFGLHSRIDSRVQKLAEAVQAGNLYVNRNQIGAVVGSQPFGGEKLSGTGPKAGGPHYLARFTRAAVTSHRAVPVGTADPEALNRALRDAAAAPFLTAISSLPGPTGELNQLSTLPRAPLLCAGPGAEAVEAQLAEVQALGGRAVGVHGALPPEVLAMLAGFSGLVWWGDAASAQSYARALAALPGPVLPLITDHLDPAHVLLERHLCVDTTAAGGNASLLAGSAS
jgi:RHH-type proline utilization regulon transcriptional repressor/proline dehydrogenase/delta 1-pyrroline-5-carboxylate dehydrogenase